MVHRRKGAGTSQASWENSFPEQEHLRKILNNDVEEVTRRQRKQGYENSGKFRGQEEWAQEIELLT